MTGALPVIQPLPYSIFPLKLNLYTDGQCSREHEGHCNSIVKANTFNIQKGRIPSMIVVVIRTKNQKKLKK